MATKTLKTTIIMRNDTAENWSTKKPILAKGEFGVEMILTSLRLATALLRGMSLVMPVQTKLKSILLLQLLKIILQKLFPTMARPMHRQLLVSLPLLQRVILLL